MKRVAATVLLAMGLMQAAAAAGQADPSVGASGVGEQARAEAASHLQAQPTEFTVVTIEPAQWSDSSLGCGKPGARAAQVMTRGYTVVLERQGERHQVNVAGKRAVMCDAATRITGTVRGPTSARGLERMAALARQDLAYKLRLDTQSILVLKTEPRHWTDDDMNCNSGGGSPAAAGNSAAATAQSSVGYRLELSASGRSYYYHTDLRSVRACPSTQ
ncbi:MAG TPA: hypothetical protein VJS12_26285 [Steroidobacteraceae bacterium]|nr:hypothetical protein [Steroidobacteraceae bacterium]